LILIVTTREHRYTHEGLAAETGVAMRVVTYDELLRRRKLFGATHIFTDVDRLPSWRVHEAALLYRDLKKAGIRVLNDPARMLGRFGLLRALNRSGMNSFDAYRAEELERPRRWPVFLRTEGDHRFPVSGLLHSQAELDEALRSSVDVGVPHSALLIIEYAAEPVRPGLFRKLSMFRVGERLLGYTCVHDDQWLVKYGKPGIAPPELYEEEYSIVANNPFADAILPAFEIAGIEYGRVDFAVVAGRPVIYEINSNPNVQLKPPASPATRRNESTELFRLNYLDAMSAIDSGPSASLGLHFALLAQRASAAPGKANRAVRSWHQKLRAVFKNNGKRSSVGPQPTS
jgi:hypothetical protein